MRILKIHIKNLNSLKGSFQLDFNDGPLQHAGIFAITGATGAGKTTILDSITLALYGRIARNKDVKEVISNGTTECHADVEFLVFDKKYLASWQMHRARGKEDGKIIGPKRELALWNEKLEAYQVIAEKIKEVDLAIEKISGLDYHRFTRSVLLSQGDFAAFLKAGERERSELLERITGTEIYSQLSIATFERHKEEKNNLDQLLSQLNQLGLFSEDLLDKKELTKAKKEAKAFEKDVEVIREKLLAFDRWNEATQKHNELYNEKKSITNLIDLFQPKSILLKRSKALTPYATDIEKIRAWTEQLGSLNITQRTLEAEYSNSAIDEKKFKQSLEEILAQQQLFEKEKAEKEVIYNQVDRLNDQLKMAKEQQLDIQSQVSNLKTSTEKKQELQNILSVELRKIDQELKQTKEWLNDNNQFSDLHVALPAIEALRSQLLEIYQNKDKVSKDHLLTKEKLEQKEKEAKSIKQELLDVQSKLATIEKKYQKKIPKELLPIEGDHENRLDKAIRDMAERVQKIKQLSLIDEDYKNLLKEQRENEDHLADLILKQSDTSKALLTQLDQRDFLKEELNYKRNIYQQQQLIINYKKDRKNLKPGDPCPLCLSTHHPFHDHPIESFVDKAKEDLEKAEKYTQKIETNVRVLLQKENELNQEIESLLGNEIKDVHGRLEEQRQKMRTYEGRIAELLHDPDQELQDGGELLNLKLKKFEEQLSKWQNIQKDLKELVQQMHEPKEKIQFLDRKQLTLNGEIQVTESQIISLNTLMAEQEDKFNQLGEQLSKKTSKYSYEFSLETAKEGFKNLRNKATEYQTNLQKEQKNEHVLSVEQLRMTHLKEEISLLNKDLKNTSKQNISITSKIDEITNQIQELVGNTSVEEARRELVKLLKYQQQTIETNRVQHQESSKQLAALKQSLKEKTNQEEGIQKAIKKETKKLLTALSKLGYTTIDEALNDRLSLEEEANLEQSALKNNNRLLEINRAIEEVTKELNKWQPSDKEKDQEESLRIEHQKSTKTYQESLHKYGQLEEKFQQQQLREKQHQVLLQKIDSQREAFNRWAQLNELIGQADGKKFRTFAQGLTLQKLVAIANQYLEKLNGRYFIHKKADADLELEIIDTYQADNRRSMYTLSGGESFLISLALAMGLSELAGKNAQIHSLFIDEGFGTLDAQSLDLALSTLENLQSEGKTIGVISHLKELKERISVQIQLHKQSNGFSSLSVV